MTLLALNLNASRAGWCCALFLVGSAGVALSVFEYSRLRDGRSDAVALEVESQSESQLDGAQTEGSGSQVDTDLSNTDQGVLHRPTRFCTDLRLFDVQVGTGSQIEGAWLATAQSPSPVLVAVGQHFGSRKLTRALLNAKREVPEVWMDTDAGPCLAALSEQPRRPLPTARQPAVAQATASARALPQFTLDQVAQIRRLAEDFPRPTIESPQGSRPVVAR